MQLPASKLLAIIAITVVGLASAIILFHRTTSNATVNLNQTEQRINQLINKTNQTSVIEQEQQINQNVTETMIQNQTNASAVQEINQLINETNTTNTGDINSTEVQELFI